jgi:hypothetical protein
MVVLSHLPGRSRQIRFSSVSFFCEQAKEQCLLCDAAEPSHGCTRHILCRGKHVIEIMMDLCCWVSYSDVHWLVCQDVRLLTVTRIYSQKLYQREFTKGSPILYLCCLGHLTRIQWLWLLILVTRNRMITHRISG